MIPAPELATALAGKTLLIFDFDGTIADSSPLHEQAFRTVLEPLGVAVDYPRIAGRSTADAIRACFEQAGWPVPVAAELGVLAARKQALGRELIRDRLQPLPAADALLRWARGRFRLALVTSGSRATIELSIERLGYSGWFDPLITADDVATAKPEPEGFLLALRESGVEPAQALIFEDSETGFAAARRSGVDYVDARRLGEMMAGDEVGN